MTQPTQVEESRKTSFRIGETIVSELGSIDILVNNAGIPGLTKAMAKRACAARGIMVNAFAPGYRETDNAEALRNDLRPQHPEFRAYRDGTLGATGGPRHIGVVPRGRGLRLRGRHNRAG